MEKFHEPVLLREVLNSLEVGDGKWYIDATLGDGGHSLEILKSGGNIIGIDVDLQALERAKWRFEENLIDINRYKLILGNFRDLRELFKDNGLEDFRFSGILLDLGVSSLQFDKPERGFSFSREGPLDMRMDPTLGVTAADLLKVLTKGELNELIYRLGEEKFSRAISDALVSTSAIKTTKNLAKLVENVYRKHGIRKWRIHPATKVFQALRIAVNDELNALRDVLPQALDILDKGGRIVIISFHSLEDRIIKKTFKEWEEKDSGKALTKKPVIPKDEEITRNPRSRSAKMRVFKKI